MRLNRMDRDRQRVGAAESRVESAEARLAVKAARLEAVSRMVTYGDATMEHYLAAVADVQAASDRMRIAQDWLMRCQGVVDEAMEYAR